ncbi:hypothetical protein [Olleya sp. R77988]|uniref:hypothetical protein n=1 Tax=Olleya sp. R77988 TaxID=3093875 RepID=UPI0037C9307A
MIHYKNIQYGFFIIILMTIIITVISCLAIFKNVFNIPIFITLLTTTIALIIFHRLTITIDNKQIKAVFGLGLIKQSIKIEDIDINSIKEVQVPWYVGIGIRLTSKGTLYNVKTGNAIYIKSKNKLFYVGTDDYDTIKNVLIKLKTENLKQANYEIL